MNRPPLALNIIVDRCFSITKAVILLLAILIQGISSPSLAAQTTNFNIEGYITSTKDGSPIAFVNIYDHTTRSGTITNEDGYFSISVGSINDSITISYIGYTSLQLVLHSGKHSYRISLDESSQLLDEIVFTYKEDPYLYELLNACRKKARSTKRNILSRAYFEQKSWKDEQQIELLEGFYNATLEKGYDLGGLELKAGRFALQPSGNRYFITIENSGAVPLMKMIEETYRFPTSPLYYGEGKMKRKFLLDLEKKYINSHGDSVYVIRYDAQKARVGGFSGRLWVNKSREWVIKAEYISESADRHPFLPMFNTHRISNVSFRITKAFDTNGPSPVLNYIDFSYRIDYNSRFDQLDSLDYTISAKSLIYFYDHGNPFFAPGFEFSTPYVSDYRKINAYPYNAFFWNYNDEYKLNDKQKRNELFFRDTASLTNLEVFKKIGRQDKGLYQHPFVSWSPKERVLLKEVMADTIPVKPTTQSQGPTYNLDVEIFVDVNTYQDSINILTRTIMDPYETYYRAELTPGDHCFINIYFDLCEIQRQELEAALQKVRADENAISKTYDKLLLKFKDQRARYLKEASRGKDLKSLTEWNQVIVEKLGIDNMFIFKMAKVEENSN